jgi:hypothetical protein
MAELMPDRKRLRSLEGFQRLPWRSRRPPPMIGIPMIAGVVVMAAIGALIGIVVQQD